MSKRTLNFDRAMLVYQGGIANVFRVDLWSEVSERRGLTERLIQADFHTCEAFARGLQRAGVELETMACNQAGDIAFQTWTSDLDEQPFSDKFRPVGPCNWTSPARVKEQGK